MSRLLRAHVAACCVCLCLSACKSRDPDRARGSRPTAPAVSDKPAILAELPADAGGAGASSSAPPPAEGHALVFAARGGGVAYVAGTSGSFRVVHNGRAGKPYAEVGTVVLSPDGRRCAHGALVDGKWRMVVDGSEGASFTAVESPVFSPDGAHVAYGAEVGESWHLVVDTTVSGGASTPFVNPTFGAGSARIVFVAGGGPDGFGALVVSDLALEKQTIVDARASTLLLNADRSRVAAVVAAGEQQRVVTFGVDSPDRATYGAKYDQIYGMDFGSDGASLTYVAERAGVRFLVLDDREAPLASGDDPISVPVVLPGKSGLGVLVLSDGAVRLRHFFQQGAEGGTGYEGAESLVYGSDGRAHAFAAKRGESWFVVASGKEGPVFDRVVSPSFSPDGKHLVYRARKDGKRFVVVADAQGRTIRQLQAYEQVFPVRFTADGKSIAYGVKDGRQLAWKVEAL